MSNTDINKLTDSRKQEIGSRIVDREIYHTCSCLIGELSKNEEYFDEIMEFSVCYDYEEAAREFIDSLNGEDLKSCIEEVPDLYSDNTKEDLLDLLEEGEDWQGFCDDSLPYEVEPTEALEFWIVSDWLADKLAERGQMTTKDFMGLSIWGRVTSGQAICLDRVIQEIACEFLTL